MKQSLLSLLCSPLNGFPLQLDILDQTQDEVMAGYLRDTAGNRFPIVEGVPLFAEAAGEDETFAFKWRMIGDSYGFEAATRQVRQNWYLERFGFGTRDELLDFLKEKRLILDAGTGSGVDAAMFADSGSTVIAIDLSQRAAQATYRHLAHLPNVHVLQADLCALPFLPDSFDYISCDQVLHHTPNPASSFASLVRHLCPGGHLALYVYRRKGPIREFTDDYLRSIATQMTAEECYELCRAVTLLGKTLSDLKAQVVIPPNLDLLNMDAGPQDVQRFFYWNVMKCFWNDDYDFLTNTMVNFDWYHPKYASRHSPEEVENWFKSHNLEIKKFTVIPSGIAALGKLAAPDSERTRGS